MDDLCDKGCHVTQRGEKSLIINIEKLAWSERRRSLGDAY